MLVCRAQQKHREGAGNRAILKRKSHMIEMKIQIERTDRGIKVHVETDINSEAANDAEKATVVSLGRSINKHMQENGFPGFDCLQQQKPAQ